MQEEREAVSWVRIKKGEQESLPSPSNIRKGVDLISTTAIIEGADL